MIKVICFDLDGVYFTNEGKQAWVNSLVKISGNPGQIDYVLSKSPEMLDFVTNKITGEQFWDFLRKELKVNLSDIELRDLQIANYEVNPEVKQLIADLKREGYQTATISNNSIVRVEDLDSRFHFLDDFDYKVFSYEVNDVKPNLPIFQELINRTKAGPSEIVYSDDRMDRLAGAIQLGMSTFVFNNFEQFKEELTKLGIKV
jgi:HAD superfamily hydrolase (TIGR01509 family)